MKVGDIVFICKRQPGSRGAVPMGYEGPDASWDEVWFGRYGIIEEEDEDDSTEFFIQWEPRVLNGYDMTNNGGRWNGTDGFVEVVPRATPIPPTSFCAECQGPIHYNLDYLCETCRHES